MFGCSAISSSRGSAFCGSDSTSGVHIQLHILALQLLDAAECSIIEAGSQQHTLAACPNGYMGQHICWSACQNSGHVLLQQAISVQPVTNQARGLAIPQESTPLRSAFTFPQSKQVAVACIVAARCVVACISQGTAPGHITLKRQCLLYDTQLIWAGGCT